MENKNAILAHHLVQSFSPEDHLTPETNYAIGRKMVLELTGRGHKFIIAMHVDKEHIHNHVVFNSTKMQTGNVFQW